MIAFIATALAVIGIVTRYATVTKPLWSWIPGRWQWAPPALLAAAGLLTDRLPSCVTGWDVGQVALEAAVLFALAASAGLHAPPSDGAA